MLILIRNLHFRIDQTVRKFIEQSIQRKLEKYGNHIRRVTIQLIDFNSRHDGNNKSCRIEVRLSTNAIVFVEKISKDLIHSVEEAAERASGAVSRSVGRSRAKRRSVQLAID
ncbi:MAG: HPF/RaiA family ribosome-associated protein [bacterium]|nr:HPF/RaiA family ribosome-associated protein [bacterium]